MNDEGPWFRSYIFGFWVIPVHRKGWMLLLAMLLSTYGLSYLILDVFEDGSVGRILCSVMFILIAGSSLTLAYSRTEKNKR